MTCGGCGAEVVQVDAGPGQSYSCERVAAWLDGDLVAVEHRCGDYLAWHLPADPRHPDDLPAIVNVRPAGLPVVVAVTHRGRVLYATAAAA